MKRILSDGWFQMFTALSATTVLVMAAQGLRPRPAPPPPAAAAAPSRAPAKAEPKAAAPAEPAAAPAAPAAPRPAVEEAALRGSPENLVTPPPQFGAVGDGPAAAPPPAANAPARLPVFRIAPKTKGRWVVSPDGDAGADSPSIARVVYSASDGDVVLLRPGRYAEPLDVARRALTFRGTGSDRAAVVLTAPVRVDGGTVRLENLSIDPGENDADQSAGVAATSARVILSNVAVRSNGPALKAAQRGDQQVSLQVRSSTLAGRYADLLVRGTARVELEDVVFTNIRQPVVVWRDAHVRGRSCRFARTAGARVYAYSESGASFAGSPDAPPVSAERGDADAAADRAQLADLVAPRPQARHLVPGPSFFNDRRRR